MSLAIDDRFSSSNHDCPTLLSQILNLPQLVVDRQEGFDDVLDLTRHPIELLERHALQLAPHLLVQAEDAPQAPSGGEPGVDR